MRTSSTKTVPSVDPSMIKSSTRADALNGIEYRLKSLAPSGCVTASVSGQAQLLIPALEAHPRFKLHAGSPQQYHPPSASHFCEPEQPFSPLVGMWPAETVTEVEVVPGPAAARKLRVYLCNAIKPSIVRVRQHANEVAEQTSRCKEYTVDGMLLVSR